MKLLEQVIILEPYLCDSSVAAPKTCIIRQIMSREFPVVHCASPRLTSAMLLHIIGQITSLVSQEQDKCLCIGASSGWKLLA